MWTMIVFVLLNGYPAISTVPGFESHDQCMSQAKEVAKMGDLKAGADHYTIDCLCVEIYEVGRMDHIPLTNGVLPLQKWIGQ